MSPGSRGRSNKALAVSVSWMMSGLGGGHGKGLAGALRYCCVGLLGGNTSQWSY